MQRTLSTEHVRKIQKLYRPAYEPDYSSPHGCREKTISIKAHYNHTVGTYPSPWRVLNVEHSYHISVADYVRDQIKKIDVSIACNPDIWELTQAVPIEAKRRDATNGVQVEGQAFDQCVLYFSGGQDAWTITIVGLLIRT